MEKKILYMDNAATTPVSESVFREMKPYFIDKYIKNYKFQILAVEISKAKTDKLPFIPFKQIGKSYEYKQDVKDGIYYLWAEEFELLKKYYTGNFKILNILYFKSCTNLFDKYINLLYNGKKETTDKGERYIYKLKLNSFGGKFGTKSMKVRKICKGNINRVGGLQFEFTEPKETKDKYYCAVTSYMTSQSRCYMIDKINQNFENFKEIVVAMFCLKSRNSEPDYNPAGKKAKELAEKMKKGRQKAVAAKGEAQKINLLSRYISILSVGENKSFDTLLGYTIYQLFDEFNRFELKQRYDIYVQAKMAGAKDLEEVDNWMKDIHS